MNDVQIGTYRPTVQTEHANKGKDRLVYAVSDRCVHYCLAGLREQKARTSRVAWDAWAAEHQPRFLTLNDIYEEHVAAYRAAREAA